MNATTILSRKSVKLTQVLVGMIVTSSVFQNCSEGFEVKNGRSSSSSTGSTSQSSSAPTTSSSAPATGGGQPRPPVVVTPAQTPAPVVVTPAQTPAPVVATPAQTPAPVVVTPAQTPAPVVATPAQTPAPVVVTPAQTQPLARITLSDVQDSYIRILGRTADENNQDLAGLTYWVNQLNSGAITMANFETSLRDSTELKIRQMYYAELARRADFSGLLYWVKNVKDGASTLESVRAEFKRVCTFHVTNECPLKFTDLDYVKQIYINEVGRTAAENENEQVKTEINELVNRMQRGELTRASVINLLRDSTELKIRQLYRDELHRRADFDGLLYWVKNVENRVSTLESVRAEFKRVCENFVNGECVTFAQAEMDAYKITAQGRFVMRLYSGLLDRPDPDLQGFLYWKKAIQNDGLSCYHLVKSFMQHSLDRAQVISLSTYQPVQRIYINKIYRGIFGREADSGGLNYWVTDILTGQNNGLTISQSINNVEDNIMRNTEFINSCYSAGLK